MYLYHTPFTPLYFEHQHRGGASDEVPGYAVLAAGHADVDSVNNRELEAVVVS